MNHNYASNAEEGARNFKKKLALAKASKRDQPIVEHFLRGTLTEQPSYHTTMDEHGYVQHYNEFDIYASWDDEKPIHLVHTNQPFDKKDAFPSAKPVVFTGCFLEDDVHEIHPITAKLSFKKEKGKSKLIASGDVLMYFDHFEVNGWATKMKNNEYQIELRALPAHGVGG
jgi:hypothetical protein